jgi:hypothetical protein
LRKREGDPTLAENGFSRLRKDVLIEYSAPRISDYGTLVELTAASGNSGNDPCRDNPPRGPKQTGAADLIQGNANLATCALSA